MIHKVILFVAVIGGLEKTLVLPSPQYQYQYGVPSTVLAPFPAPPQAPFPAPPPGPFPASLPAPRVTSALLNAPVQEDAGALELLPPLQHVVGTKYPAVSPGRGYRFPISQLLNPTPPPNLKH